MAGTTADKLQHLLAVKQDLKDAITEKGQSVGDVLSAYPDAVRAIQSGIDTGDATAAAADLRSGKTAYVKGKKISGTMATYSGSSATSNGTLYTAGKYCANNINVNVAPPSFLDYGQNAAYPIALNTYPTTGFCASCTGLVSGNLYSVCLMYYGDQWTGGAICQYGTAIGQQLSVTADGSSSSITRIFLEGNGISEEVSVNLYAALALMAN